MEWEYKAHKSVYLKCTPFSKAVHGFAHLAHGTYHFSAYSKYGSVQSARDMNLSFIAKTVTAISVPPDILSSV